jgi:murein DD-endopeptidase MepM/ murein hydrolase activator NlpD
LAEWRTIADRLPPTQLPAPSECPFPETADLLPNAPRRYRGGVHAGVDFGCPGRGFLARAALSGRVVMVQADFVEASPADRDALLEQARALGYTPPWTLAFLYGRFVVLDHGLVDGVGHVTSVSAHLDKVSELRPGSVVEAGTVLGEIGNRGTESGAQETEGQIHLHWELYVGEQFFGQGLSAADTLEVYRRLFGLA